MPISIFQQDLRKIFQEDRKSRGSLEMNELHEEMRIKIIDVLVNFLHNKQIYVTRIEFPELFHKIKEIFPNEEMVSIYISVKVDSRILSLCLLWPKYE